MKFTLLDQRINDEIRELIRDGKIQSAKDLCKVVKKSDRKKPSLSYKGLPSYYFGNREAKTVMVNLNPGEDVDKNKENWKLIKRWMLPENPSQTDIGKFIDKYHEFQKNFANLEYKTDSFDVKQAAFLTPWENNEIGLPENPDWSDNDTCAAAAKAVVSNKLQLELLPYASAKFDINKKGDVKLLFPYIETLLDEIFAKKRTYVIFASSKFEYIFKQYNKISGTETFVLGKLYNPEPSLKKIHDGSDGKLHVKCRVVWINYKGKTQPALIAHTFPSQGLGRAYDLMQTYGRLCYEQWCQNIK